MLSFLRQLLRKKPVTVVEEVVEETAEEKSKRFRQSVKQTTHNADRFLEIVAYRLAEDGVLEISESIYSDALDFNYTRFDHNLKYLTVYLNIGFDGRFFLSAGRENTRASIPVYHLYDYGSTRYGFYRESLNVLCSEYVADLKEMLAPIGADVKMGHGRGTEIVVTITKL